MKRLFLGVDLDEKKKKQMIYIVMGIVIVLTFVSSYAAFSNTNTTTASTTIQNQSTFFAVGATNAIVVGYGQSAGVLISNAVYGTTVNNYLSGLQTNGILTNVVSFNNTFAEVFFQNTSKYGAYELQQALANALNSNSITAINATTSVTLPKTVTMSISTQLYTIPIPQHNYTMTIMPVPKRGTIIPVNVHAIVTQNGQLYNNQITLTQR